MIYIHEILDLIPDILKLFVPGFIFMQIIKWYKPKQIDTLVLCIESIVISYVITILCSSAHLFILRNVTIPFPVKVTVYFLCAVILAAITISTIDSKLLRKIVFKFNRKTLHEDILDDVVDRHGGTFANVYLKNSEYTYLGKVCYVEEKGENSYIALSEYSRSSNDPDVEDWNSEEYDVKTLVIFSLKDISHIEFLYEGNCEVYNALTR